MELALKDQLKVDIGNETMIAGMGIVDEHIDADVPCIVENGIISMPGAKLWRVNSSGVAYSITWFT